MLSYFLISNMFPSEDSPGYGSFVKNVSDSLANFNIIRKYDAVISGRSKGRIAKLWKYLNFYYKIVKRYWYSYDFIYLHFPNQAIPILQILLKLKRKPLIVNLHGEDLIYNDKGYGYKLGVMMEKVCHKYAQAIVVPSDYFKRIVLQRNILPEDKIIVSPSGGINPDIFYPMRAKSYIKDNICIGYVGRLEPDKGIREFLDVCLSLSKLRINFSGIIIGYGSCYDESIEFITRHHLQDRLTIINGISQKELGKYYRDMDLLIFSSSRKAESLGLTGIEALACGTPVIGSNIGGIASYIKPNYNGWLTPIHDISAITNIVLKYIETPAKVKEYIRQNCICSGQKYYCNKVCDELASNLKRLF